LRSLGLLLLGVLDPIGIIPLARELGFLDGVVVANAEAILTTTRPTYFEASPDFDKVGSIVAYLGLVTLIAVVPVRFAVFIFTSLFWDVGLPLKLTHDGFLHDAPHART
jgi:hypothetical protein